MVRASCTVAALVLAAGAIAQLPLHVCGTRVLDAKNRPVRLRGVNAASLEWSSDGEGHILEAVRVAIDDWRSNIVRIPLSQDRWFGAGPEQRDRGIAYRALVDSVVKLAASKKAYIMLDLHWSNAGHWGQNIGQHVMPDQNSVTFWRDLARTYKNHPAVLFDLYNEPHDVSYDIWLHGGSVTERGGRDQPERKFEAVGMQTLLDTVRKTGAKNVVVVGGLDWSYDLAGILAGRQLDDRGGNGIIYACHAYPFKGDTVEKWEAKMATAAKRLPIIVSEFGSDEKGGAGLSGETWVRRVLQVINRLNLHYTAWDLHPAAGPTLISDWKFTPTPHFGALVKGELRGGG